MTEPSKEPAGEKPVKSSTSLIEGLVVIGITCGILFVLTEVTLRIMDKMRIKYDVEMTRYANEVKVKDPNPRIGHSHRPNANAHLMGVDVSINSRGFRDRDYPIEKVADQRIIFLGDSLTFGWGVEKQETFEELLEKDLNRTTTTEIINLGTGNHNTDQQVQLFIDRGLKLKPDRVVLFYFINDAEPTPQMSPWHWLSHLRSVTWFWSKIRVLRTRLGESPDYRQFYRGLYDENQSGWQVTQAAMKELVKVCADNDIRLQVVILPELHDLTDYPFTEVHEKITAMLTDLNIEYLDLMPLIVPRENPQKLWVAPDDAHPNHLGHRLIADHTRTFLESNGDQ